MMNLKVPVVGILRGVELNFFQDLMVTAFSAWGQFAMPTKQSGPDQRQPFFLDMLLPLMMSWN